MKRILLFALAGYALLFALRVQWLLQSEAGETLKNYVGQTVDVVGTVADDPDKRETSLHVSIAVEKIDGAPASGGLLALVPRETHVSYSDVVEVRGVLALPQSFETDTGHIFDYPSYLRVRGISAEITRATFVSRVTPRRTFNPRLTFLS